MTLDEAVYRYSTPHVAVHYILYEHVVYVPYSLIHPPALVVCLTSDAALCSPYTRRSVLRRLQHALSQYQTTRHVGWCKGRISVK